MLNPKDVEWSQPDKDDHWFQTADIEGRQLKIQSDPCRGIIYGEVIDTRPGKQNDYAARVEMQTGLGDEFDWAMMKDLLVLIAAKQDEEIKE